MVVVMAACCCRSMLYPRVNDTLVAALCFGLYHSASRALRHSPPLVLSKTAVVAVVEGHCLGARDLESVEGHCKGRAT